VRLFVGLALDEAVRAAAASVSSRLERKLSSVARDFEARWVPAGNLHVTVWFFGEVGEAPAARLVDHLGAPLGLPPFDLHVGGCGAFPPSGAPRVLWIGTAGGTPGMIDAHAALIERLRPLGYAPETRAYSPHLTLARVKAPGRSPAKVRDTLAAEAGDCGSMAVTALTLFRSRLSPHGATYERLLRVPLA
jgi:2'-5' RNA ligase